MTRKPFQNPLKNLPEWLLEASLGASGGLWAPSGAEGGSQERSGVPPRVFLAPLGSLLAPLGALLGCSWRLLGRSGGVLGTLLAQKSKTPTKNLLFKDRFATLSDVFVDPPSSRKLLGET